MAPSQGGGATSLHVIAVTLQYNAMKLRTACGVARIPCIAPKDFTNQSQLDAPLCAKCAARHRHCRHHENRLF
jgi:hypothetical protein